MKKSRIVFGLMLLLMACRPAGARCETRQSDKTNLFTGGPIVEMNYSNFSHKGIEGGSSRERIGFGVGGFLNMEITDFFSVQGELVFNYKTSGFSWQQNSGDYKYWGITIPIYVMFAHRLDNGDRISIGIGPYTDFGLSASFNNGNGDADLYERATDTGYPLMKDSDTGFSVKIGYEWRCGLQVNASLRHSVSNIIDANSSDVKMYPQVITVGLAYRFGK